jgi:hypothetical protein
MSMPYHRVAEEVDGPRPAQVLVHGTPHVGRHMIIGEGLCVGRRAVVSQVDCGHGRGTVLGRQPRRQRTLQGAPVLLRAKETMQDHHGSVGYQRPCSVSSRASPHMPD